MRMPVVRPEIRVLISLTLASAVPGVAALGTSQGGRDPIDELIGAFIWSVFSFFIVVPLGVASYYALRRTSVSFLLFAPILGALAGAAVGRALFQQGMYHSQFLYFLAVGALTGLTAAVVDSILIMANGKK